MLSASTRTRDRTRARAGFSLIELLVVMSILAIVMTSVMTIFVQQQRFYSGTAAIMQTRSSTHDAAYVLQSELRTMSPKNLDIYAMGANFIEFRSQLGASVVCTIDATKMILTVPPLKLATESALTSWLSPPAIGDTLVIFDPGALPGPAQDSFRLYTLTATPIAAAACPNSTGLTTTAGEATQGITLRVTPALTATTPVGAPIRFLRRARYEVYQEASGNWYLGHFDCVPLRVPVCTPLQALAGPYVAPNGGGTGGIVFTFRDATGAITADKSLVRRVDLAARAQTPIDIRIPGYKNGAMTDSAFSSIAPRN